MPVSTTAQIRLDDRGMAWIDDTNTKVVEVALDMIAHGVESGGNPLSVRAPVAGADSRALGYYYDHKAEMDAHIQRSAHEVERLRAQAGESPIRKRLREMGKLA